MKDLFFGFLVTSALIGGFIFLLIKNVDLNERTECRKWQEQAAMYEGFYLVQWQADQCAAHNILVNAPVK